MFIFYARIGMYPQNLYKFSFIYKQKYAYLKYKKSENKLISRQKQI